MSPDGKTAIVTQFVGTSTELYLHDTVAQTPTLATELTAPRIQRRVRGLR